MPGRGSISDSQQTDYGSSDSEQEPDPRGSVFMDDDESDKKSKRKLSALENMPEEKTRKGSKDLSNNSRESDKDCDDKSNKGGLNKSPTHSERLEKNSNRSEKSSDKAEKTSVKSDQMSDRSEKISVRSRKNSDRSEKYADRSVKNTDRSERNSDRSERDTDRSVEKTDRSEGNSDRSEKDTDRSSNSQRSNADSSGHSQESGRNKKHDSVPVLSPKSDGPKTEKSENTQKTEKTKESSKTERSQDSSNSSETPADDTKQGKKKYGFRLTPEEQELAYELKAGMMRRLDDQNAKLNRELANHNKFQGVRQKQQERAYSAKYSKDDRLSRVNAIKLMRMYEKKSKDSDERIKKLEADLEDSQDLAKRYRDMYVAEKDRGGGSNSQTASPKKGNESQQQKDKNKTERESDEVNEDDLDDDVALYKRHVTKLAETGKMVTTSPIRIADIIRKNEVLLIENDLLKREIQRLRRDNAELVINVKHSREERDVLLHNIGTSEAARVELIRRLEREQKEHKKLHKSLTLQASDWINARKEMQSVEDTRRWQQINPYYGKKYSDSGQSPRNSPRPKTAPAPGRRRSDQSQSLGRKNDLTPIL